LEIDAFFIDNIDYKGIEFWYEDVKEVVKDMKAK